MIRRAARPQANYTVLQNAVLLDQRLSYRARGLLCAILARPDNWKVRADQLAREGSEGRGAVLTALKELRTVGYLHLHRTRLDDGTFRTEQVVYDTAWLADVDAPREQPESRNRTPDNRTSVDRMPDDPTLFQEQVASTENKNPTHAHASVSKPAVLDLFDTFWSAYPRKVGKGAAGKRWQRMSDADRAAALDAVRIHAGRWQQQRTEARFIPHPATWLSQARWLDDLTTEATRAPSMPSAVRHAADMLARLRAQAPAPGSIEHELEHAIEVDAPHEEDWL